MFKFGAALNLRRAMNSLIELKASPHPQTLSPKRGEGSNRIPAGFESLRVFVALPDDSQLPRNNLHINGQVADPISVRLARSDQTGVGRMAFEFDLDRVASKVTPLL